jgi:hypothetical protein
MQDVDARDRFPDDGVSQPTSSAFDFR